MNLGPAGGAGSLNAGLETLGGVLRSIGIYHLWREARARRAPMDRLYAGFLGAGDLAFDIGSHVGDRVASFRRLGARVVAVEPQPALLTTLRFIFGRDAEVVIEPFAVGATAGSADLMWMLPLDSERSGQTASVMPGSFSSLRVAASA